MVELVSPSGYLHQLQALLPRGRAWPRDLRAVLTALLDAIAQGKARLDRRAAALLLEAHPSSATQLLPEWEAMMGLPDSCSQPASGIAARRAAVRDKYAGQPDLSAASFVELGRSFGVEIQVFEHDQARAATATTLDTTGGKWRFVWWISIPTTADVGYFDTLSTVDTLLRRIERNTELECRLKKIVPSHTLLILGYRQIVEIELPAHAEPANNQIEWKDTAGLGDVSALRAAAGDAELVWLKLFGDGADNANRIVMRTVEAPDGSLGPSAGPNLSQDWERFSAALRLKVTGLADLVVAGPDNAAVAAGDAAEPYNWLPGAGASTYVDTDGDAAGLQRWVVDFKAAYANDNTLRATLVLDAGR